MVSNLFTRSFKGIRFLRNPRQEFKVMVNRKRGEMNILLIFLSGIMLVQYWADIFNLGDHYPTGKIMTFSLILGPIGGLMFILAGTFFQMFLGNIFDKRHKPKFKFVPSDPPVPMRKMVWWKVYGKEKFEEKIDKGSMKWWKRLWSNIISETSFINRVVSGGRVGYSVLLYGLNMSLYPLVFLAFLQMVQLVFLDGEQFGSDRTLVFHVFTVLKAGCFFWFMYFWYLLAKRAFRTKMAITIFITLASFCLSVLLVCFLFVWVFDILLWV